MAWRVIVTFVPLVPAFYGPFTGISDNRHFLDDVLFGAFIGSVLGAIFYHIYFPGICNTLSSGKAYPPRKIGVPFLLGPLACFWPLDESPRVEIDGFPPDVTVTLPQSMQECLQGFEGQPNSIINQITGGLSSSIMPQLRVSNTHRNQPPQPNSITDQLTGGLSSIIPQLRVSNTSRNQPPPNADSCLPHVSARLDGAASRPTPVKPTHQYVNYIDP